MTHWLDEIDARRPAVTPELLRIAMPRCPDLAQWADDLSEALAWGEIRDADEIAMFLAQVGHESSDLTRLEESLFYSAQRMTEVWPSRYPTIDDARPYARNPEALANHTYGGRMGNIEPGDGWKFRGRGPIQLTGRFNYTACAEATGLNLLENPDQLASSSKSGAMAAVWFWLRNVPSGAGIETATRKINGGTHGLADRRERYLAIMDSIENSRNRGHG